MPLGDFVDRVLDIIELLADEPNGLPLERDRASPRHAQERRTSAAFVVGQSRLCAAGRCQPALSAERQTRRSRFSCSCGCRHL